MRAIFISDDIKNISNVYSLDVKEELKKYLVLDDKIYTKKDLALNDLSDVSFLFSTWGMPKLSEEEIKRYFPNLKAVFYSAGTVKYFAKPFLDQNIQVFSAWRANAIPVIEYTVSAILLANKGFYQLLNKTKKDYHDAKNFFYNFKGNYNAKIGIIGSGAIGLEVIKRLRNYKLDVYVYSITMSKDEAKDLGVTLTSLEYMFENSQVISNHLADNEQTIKIINENLLALMPDYATFINTGRGRQVDEDALIKTLKNNKTITALLDVTYPEPPVMDSELYTLDNVFLTPHIAGSSGEEVKRMGEYMKDEFLRYLNNDKLEYEVTKEMLEMMA